MSSRWPGRALRRRRPRSLPVRSWGQVGHRAGEPSSPDSSDLLDRLDRVPGFGLIDRPDLVAALDRAAEKKVTIVAAPAGSGKTSLLRLWASRQDHRRIAFMSVRPGQQDPQL